MFFGVIAKMKRDRVGATKLILKNFSLTLLANYDFQLDWIARHLGGYQSISLGVSVRKFSETIRS